MEYQKITNLLGNIPDKVPRFITNRDRKNRFSIFKNNAPFISCISKINGVIIENAEI